MTIPEYTRKCPEGAVEVSLQVTAGQTDRTGRMKLSALAWNITALAFTHLESFGFNRDEMIRNGKLWMVIWNQMEFVRIPREGETILLRVWAGKAQSIMLSRRFAIYTEAGEPVGTASGLLAVIDAKTRMISSDIEEFRKIPVIKIPNEPRRVSMFMEFPEEYAEEFSCRVQPSQIDPNGHMNNSFYFDWVTEGIPEAYTDSHEPESVWVEYRKELLEGQTAVISRVLQDDVLYASGRIGEENSFSIKITWRSTKE